MEYTQPGIIKEQLEIIKGMTFARKVDIPLWRTRKARYTVPVQYEDYTPWEEIRMGDTWICDYEDSRWFEADVTVPESFAGGHLVLELMLGGEGLVSVNGQPMGSLAFYHAPNTWGPDKPIRHRTRIELGERKAGEVLHISCQMNMNYKDHYKGNRFVKYNGDVKTTYTLKFARLCLVDDEAEGLWYDACALWDAVSVLGSPADTVIQKVHTPHMGREFELMMRAMSRDGMLTQRMTELLQKALLVIPFYGEESAMRKAFPEARAILKAGIEELPAAQRGSVWVSGLAHIDLVWLWQEKHSVRKIANTSMNTLALIERYPEYIFTFSQPCAFAWLEEHYPDIFKRVQQAVRNGNIDPVGNLWVEVDCNLAGGEALIRQLLYGRAYYLEKFGKASDIFLMPDSFGYTGALPQIMAKSGIRYFLSAKLASNENYRFPYTFFNWQGIDGTRVPTYLMRVAYNGEINCNHLDQAYHRQDCKRITDESYMTFGYGDGGGGPDDTMLQFSRRLTNMPGIPKLKMATLDDFFEKATQRKDEFPVWNDELYFDRHRGTYTTQARVKKNNRKAELALRKTEMAASLREVCLGIPYPAAELESIWKMLLHLQFHDSLPGSSITYVYDDVEAEFARIFAKQEALYGQILADLTAAVPHEAETAVAWNFLGWQRTENTGSGVVTMPSLGWSAEATPGEGVSVSERVLENKFFRMELDGEGRIVSLVHKESGRETIKAPSNTMHLFEDPAKDRLSAWDSYMEYTNKEQVIPCASVEVVENTPAKGAVRLVWRFGRSELTQDITIYSDTQRIDFVTHANWQEDMHMLKAAFFPKVRASRATYEIQFGAVERPTHRNTEYDAIRFEGSAHKWADLSQSDFGLSILSDSKYGYDILDDRMRITLLRAPVEPDYKADRGEHDFVYSLYPHAGSWQDGGTVQAGFALNVPADLCKAPATQDAVPRSFVAVAHDSVVLDTFKKAEDGKGYILRLYESAGKGGRVKLTFAKTLKSVTAVSMMEEDEAPVPTTGNTLTFETTPYCIHSYRVEF